MTFRYILIILGFLQMFDWGYRFINDKTITSGSPMHLYSEKNVAKFVKSHVITINQLI